MDQTWWMDSVSPDSCRTAADTDPWRQKTSSEEIWPVTLKTTSGPGCDKYEQEDVAGWDDGGLEHLGGGKRGEERSNCRRQMD